VIHEPQNPGLAVEIEVMAAGFERHGGNNRLPQCLIIARLPAQHGAQIGRMLLP
jgi:hypothetical protein